MSVLALCALTFTAVAQNAAEAVAGPAEWPVLRTENYPGSRWWWLGSAVDKENLTWNLEYLRNAGIASVEITPIYGVKGEESRDIPYLSPKWMDMLKYVGQEAGRLNMLVDMNGGTGWPFGGPNIRPEDAAACQFVRQFPVQARTKGKYGKAARTYLPQSMDVSLQEPKQKGLSEIESVLFVGDDGSRCQIPLTAVQEDVLNFVPEKDGRIYVRYCGRTRQQVKRSAPGGEGLVMNHLSKDALSHYLERFDKAFAESGVAWPHSFFNDSYEVYGADWSGNLREEFKARRGYDIDDYLPEFTGVGHPDTIARVICDYRQTLAEMLLDNFTRPWTEWAHSHGVTTRNQAHGSPGNLLDLYAAMDIPECESFGCTLFDIPGLRVDSDIRRNDGDPASLRYASSASHVSGKTYTSSESMTWLTEHFRTSLALIKPEMDQLFANGVNRVFYHGTPYTPQEAPWPGWLFYASILVNPNNTIFRDMSALNMYIARIQSFMQSGTPDNELLLYFPIYDIWENFRKSNYVAFDIHKLGEKLPRFDRTVADILGQGYTLDYISDAQLMRTRYEKNTLVTEGNDGYRSVLVPMCEVIPVETMRQLLNLAEQGAEVLFYSCLPSDVPGLKDYTSRQEQLRQLLASTGLTELTDAVSAQAYGKGRLLASTDLQRLLKASRLSPEPVTGDYGASIARRKEADGHTYFISMLENRTLADYVELAVPFEKAMIFNPMNGEKGLALQQGNKVYLQLDPGESLIVRTFNDASAWQDGLEVYPFYQPAMDLSSSVRKKLKDDAFLLRGKWTFRFDEKVEGVEEPVVMDGEPRSWTELEAPDAHTYAGSGWYSLDFKMPVKPSSADNWMLDFGNGLYESARVYVNGQEAGIVWSTPYRICVGPYLRPGKNHIELKVTNLPANRIADYDRRGVNWRIFKDINVVSVFYKDITFDVWDEVPSGLTETPRLIPMSQVE